MSHLLPINKKEFYIDLHESRYYFPGDLLKGTVVLNLGKPTKTNHIRITFTGTVQADGSTAQVLNTSWCLATSPLNDGKPYLLQAQTHRLPFEFRLPNDDDTKLPSSLKLSSSMGVKYMITAVHDRPFVPERLCSVIKKEIRVLERIDISQPKYGARGYVDKDVRVFGNLPISGEKVHLSLTLPRYAVVRGDILPLEIHIKHYQKLVRVDGVKVHLLRRVYTGKNRRKLDERKSIKSNTLPIDLTPSNEFEQKISTKLLVPTNTPPTLSQNGRILAVEYAVRAVVNINDAYGIYRKNFVKLESSVVIGTYPEPNLSIDDDDDDDNGGVVAVEGSEDIDGSDDDDGGDEEEVEDAKGDTILNNNTPTTSSGQSSSSSSTSSAAHVIEPPAMHHHSSTTSSTPKQQHQRDPRYSLSQQLSSSSLTVVDPTTPPLTSQQPSTPKQQQQQQRDPRHLLSQQSSSSLTKVDPTTPPLSNQQPSTLKQQQQQRDPRYSLSHQQQPSSSSSLTIVDPTTASLSIQQQRQSLTTVDPTVPKEQHQRNPRHSLPQQRQSSSSSLTVVDPTAPTGHQHSYLPRQQPSSSALIVDPTSSTHNQRQQTHYHAPPPPPPPPKPSLHTSSSSSTSMHRFSMQQASVIDPTTKHNNTPILHRNESTISTLSSLSSTSSRSSSSGGSSSGAMLVEPVSAKRYDPKTMMMSMKTDRHPSATPTSPPLPMASMPDITAYVPSKSSGQQQKKRPPLHLNPIATNATPLSPHQHTYPLSPAATTVSPGGFVVPMPTHTHHQQQPALYPPPPPLPPRRPSSQQQQQHRSSVHYYQQQQQQQQYPASSPSYSPTSPWS